MIRRISATFSKREAQKFKSKGKRIMLALSLMLLVTFIIYIGFIKSTSPAAQAVSPTGLSWWTLGAGIYRNASVPNIISGNLASPVTSILYSPSDYYSINTNPLIVDMDGDGISEIIVVDAAGRLVIVDGNGNLKNDPDSSFHNLSPYSVPAAVDLDGDNVPEIVTGTKDGRVVVIDVDLTQTPWTTIVVAESQRIDSKLTTSPLVWDLDHDGVYEIIVSSSSGIYCFEFTGSSLSLKWSKIIWEKEYLSSPAALNDLNSDGVTDLVYATAIGRVYVISGREGSIIKTINLYNDPQLRYLFLIHSPLVANLDDNPNDLEIAVDLGIENFTTTDYTRSGVTGYVVIIDTGTWSYQKLSGPFIWFTQPSMAAADVDGDGMAELFISNVGDGHIYRIDYDPTTGSYTISRLTQSPPDNWATAPGTPSNALALAVADVIGGDNGGYEIIAYATYQGTTGSYNKYYRLQIIDPITGNVESEVIITYSDLGLSSSFAKFSWPTLSIADIDGDGLLEVVVTAYNSLIVIDG